MRLRKAQRRGQWEKEKGNENGFIPDASLLFSTKSQSADFHGDMCAELFTKWFKDSLIPNISEPSLIIMDNASYHSKLTEKAPNTSSNKEEICQYLLKHNVPYEPTMFKKELLHLVVDNAKPKVYEIDEIANSYGHRVLRLPPYHCQFNPIELVWGNCKEFYNKNIGRNNVKFDDNHVKEIWTESLGRFMSEWWTIEKRFELVQPLIIAVSDSTSESDTDTE
ncbi:hypothetical protein PPYR_02073 [Photinus pyralis]|uniref:Tc1-like transposase DDE domain-containing protein n=1 Tax=Photinus pyralis TaxID=7054 RepID=A0A5N4B6C9_PHOPY|nr:hypothetical protein PPYR_02073 [Photinus pyralis]